MLGARVDRGDALTRVLVALEANAQLAPQRWGAERFIREQYARDRVLAHMRTAEPGEGVIHLRARTEFAYLATCYAEPDGGPVSSLDIESTGDYTAEQAGAFFASVAALAESLEPDLEFGSIDVEFAEQDPETFMRPGVHAHPLGPYLRQGPDIVFPRMFFGRRLVQLLEGPALLEQSGGVVVPLGTHGACMLDLLEQPWTASPKELKAAQISIEKRLQLSGLFARQAGRWKTIAGPRWESPAAP
jgi:hypothetical protein